LVIRPAQADDYGAWLALWRGYCAALGSAVPDTATDGVWHRILTPDEPVGCLLACRPEGEPVGLANYVLHPNTWSLQTICYLNPGEGAIKKIRDQPHALPIDKMSERRCSRLRWRGLA
jgi:hypothetical protein